MTATNTVPSLNVEPAYVLFDTVKQEYVRNMKFGVEWDTVGWLVHCPTMLTSAYNTIYGSKVTSRRGGSIKGAMDWDNVVVMQLVDGVVDFTSAVPLKNYDGIKVSRRPIQV